MPTYLVSVDISYEYWHRHVKLITALRTAVEKGEGTLDKEATSQDDLMDAFRMSLIFWQSLLKLPIMTIDY
jgi:hypothetical protein